ncbi:hypothetical protein EJB05_55412, partial [Eragrostis curvula]
MEVWGVPDLRDLNLSLLGSWVKRYFLDEGKLWREVIDFKYRTESPNVLNCQDREASQFWKGVMWAAKAVQLGYRWRVGNGRKVRFWEDNWLGSSSLLVQYWDLYVIVNERSKTIAEIWDGINLKCTFRRCVDSNLMRRWEEVLQIASTIVLTDEEDKPIWQYTPNGIYSSQSMYGIINFRVAKRLWSELDDLFKLGVISSFDKLATYWLSKWEMERYEVFMVPNPGTAQELEDIVSSQVRGGVLDKMCPAGGDLGKTGETEAANLMEEQEEWWALTPEINDADAGVESQPDEESQGVEPWPEQHSFGQIGGICMHGATRVYVE